MADRPLHIAHIGWVASCHLVRRVDELCRYGHRCVVYTDNIPAHFDPGNHAFDVVDLPKSLFETPLGLVQWLENSLADFKADVLHAHSTHFPASLAYFVRNTPVISSPWDFANAKDPFSPLFNRAILEELPHSTLMDGISFSSKPYMETVVAEGLSQERAFWHSWGVDFANFEPGRFATEAAQLREHLGIRPDEVVLLSPRTPSLPANADIAMQATARLAESHPVRLIVTGHHITRESGYYERLLAHPDIAACTVCMDTVRGDTAIATLYEASDIVLSIHNNDFNPATALEAFAMERPVLAHDIDTVAFWVREGETGWMVPPRDVDATADKLAEILAMDKVERQAVGRAGRKRVMELANFHETMARVPADYASIASLSRISPRPPLGAYDKGLLHDIMGHPETALKHYEDAVREGESRSLLPELLEEKTAMVQPDKGLDYFCSKRCQPTVLKMAQSDPPQWPELAKQLPVPMSLFRHDFIAGFLPLLQAGKYDQLHRLIECLAKRFETDTLEWIGETVILFGRRFGMWEECADLFDSVSMNESSLTALKEEAYGHLAVIQVAAPARVGLLQRKD